MRFSGVIKSLFHVGWVAICSYGLVYYLQSHMDLSPLFGPGGVKSIAALLADYPQRDWGTWVMNLFQRWTDNPADAARLSIWIGNLCTLLGISLCAHRLSSWAGARSAAVITLCFAPLLWNTILIGPDGIATGIAWLGIGIAWKSTEAKWWWSIPLTCLGAVCCIFAAKVKITALPCAAYLGVVPLLAMKPKWWGKAEGIFVGVFCAYTLLYLRSNWMPATNNHIAGGQAAGLNRETLELGWQQLQKVFDEEDVIVQLAMVAIVGAILPGRNWLARLGIALLCGAVLSITASTLGMKIRPRYFVAAELPILILVANALTQYRWQRRLGQVIALGIAIVLWMDTLAYHAAWSDMMTELSGSNPHTLPKVPDGYQNRYRKFPRLDHDDHSTIGVKRLLELATDADSLFIYGVPLRDGREHHLEAFAGLTGHKYGLLTPKFCCSQITDLDQCAKQTIDAIQRSNATLILPIVTTNQNRIPNDTRRWYQYLLRYAKEGAHWELEGQWATLVGLGNQKPPCDRPPRRPKGFWEIDGEGYDNPHSGSNQRGMPDATGPQHPNKAPQDPSWNSSGN